MTLGLTEFDALLKEHYTADRVEDMTYQNNPFLALVPKYEKFGGDVLPVPVIYGNPQGRSASFTRAQTRGQSSNTASVKFNLTRVQDYGITTIDNETMEASVGNENAFLEARITEVDGLINSLTNSLANALFREGWGDIGVVGSFTGATVTLATIPDIVNFEVGMELMVASAQSTATLRALGTSGNGLIITGINRTTGVLTFGADADDAADGIPTIANADYIFVRGDREDSATPTREKIAGLAAWVPASDPASTSFFGVDRTADITRLGGLRYDGSAMPIEEALIHGADLVGREGFAIDHYLVSYSKWTDLRKSLGSRVEYVDLKATGRIAFRAIVVSSEQGDVMVTPDRNCPDSQAFGLKLDTWKLCSLKKCPRVLNSDGLQMLRMATADGVEVRYGYYANLRCNAPGANINLSL